jgi:molybdopterin synthase catalytic subunit
MSEIKLKNIFVQGAIPSHLIAESIEKHASRKDIGAHSIFLGQVRGDRMDDKIVSAIEYTAYEEMAVEKMNAIREEIFNKYDLSCMHVYHSLGRVEAGAICLFVFASSAHREAAADACREMVEQIKSGLPVWGKEIFNDSTHQWKTNK